MRRLGRYRQVVMIGSDPAMWFTICQVMQRAVDAKCVDEQDAEHILDFLVTLVNMLGVFEPEAALYLLETVRVPPETRASFEKHLAEVRAVYDAKAPSPNGRAH